MKGYLRYFCLTAALVLILCAASSLAETPAEETEQGVDELQPLLEINDVENTEGMSLEEMTDAFTESAMSEYFDITTGFSMQYPSIFTFDEELQGSSAATDDRKATLTIDNMENQGSLDEEALRKQSNWRTLMLTSGKTNRTDACALTVLRKTARKAGQICIF